MLLIKAEDRVAGVAQENWFTLGILEFSSIAVFQSTIVPLLHLLTTSFASTEVRVVKIEILKVGQVRLYELKVLIDTIIEWIYEINTGLIIVANFLIVQFPVLFAICVQ